MTSVNGIGYTWDSNGNLLSDGVRTYSYDHANRLTQVVSGTLTTEFTYDGLGNRTATTVDGVTTRYALDVAGGLPEVIVATTGGTSTQYLQVAGQILAQYDSGTWGYILPDHLGSVRTETDAVGQVTVARDFDPFGVPMQVDGGSPFGYTGEWWESQAELLYLRARYYQPGMGRFTQRDPWRGNYQKPLTMNPYLYVLANPIRWVDPTGFYPPENGFKLGCGLGEGCVIHEVVTFIVERMREDAASQDIKEIRELNESHLYEDAWEAYEKMTWWQKLLFGNEYLQHALEADMAARDAALARFGCLVADARSRPVCGQWDYKADIGRPDRWGNAQRIDFCSIGIEEEVIFYYDIWANIHFGYLGMTGGFSEDFLLTGAAVEHMASNPGQFKDDPSDQACTRIGAYLYRSALTVKALLRQLYMHRHELNKAIVEDGIIKGIYQ